MCIVSTLSVYGQPNTYWSETDTTIGKILQANHDGSGIVEAPLMIGQDRLGGTPLDLAMLSDSIPKIVLRRKFLKPLKFVFADSITITHPVYRFSGLTFHPQFENLMSRHPAALKEAKRAYLYHGAILGGNIALTTLAAKGLIDTINDAQRVSEGEFVYSGLKIGDVVLNVVIGIVTIVSGRRAYHHVKEGIRMFNEDQESNPVTLSQIIVDT